MQDGIEQLAVAPKKKEPYQEVTKLVFDLTF